MRAGPLTSAYVRLWVLHQLLMGGVFTAAGAAATQTVAGGQHYFALTIANSTSLHNVTRIIGAWGAAVWFTALAALVVRPRAWLLCACHLVAIYMHMKRMPFLWDFELWDALVESCVVLAFGAEYLRGGLRTELNPEWIIESSAMPVKLTVAGLYAYTVFWKLTSSFFGPMSCGPIFTLSLLDAYTPASFESSALVWLVGYFAPHVTVILEAAIPISLWLAPMPVGLLLSSIFHVLIALAPPPNNAAIFSVRCVLQKSAPVPAVRDGAITLPPLNAGTSQPRPDPRRAPAPAAASSSSGSSRPRPSRRRRMRRRTRRGWPSRSSSPPPARRCGWGTSAVAIGELPARWRSRASTRTRRSASADPGTGRRSARRGRPCATPAARS